MFGSHIYKNNIRIAQQKYILFQNFILVFFFSRQTKKIYVMFAKTQYNSQWEKMGSNSEKYRQCNVWMSVVSTLFCHLSWFLSTGLRFSGWKIVQSQINDITKITVVLFIYLALNKLLSTGINKESWIFGEGSLFL